MALNNWKKLENEVGYPCYIDENTGQQQYDHPEFQKILQSLEEYDKIKYSVYRIAFKIWALQKHLRVPPLRISSGVFARHQLSLSETSLSLDTAELEAVLADIYFAAEKEGLFTGDVDMTVDLLINLLLNVFDRDRKEPVRVLAAKTLLIILSDEPVSDKWAALANCSADHNGCVSPRRLAALLTHVAALPEYLGCPTDQIQADVDACFDKSAGMLGASARAVSAWGAAGSASAPWLGAAPRVARSRAAPARGSCGLCARPLAQVLRFKCSKCSNVYFCENCYLYDKDLTAVNGHKKTHLVQEVLDGELEPAECMSFMKGMKRFFFCTRTKKKKMTKKGSKKSVDKVENHGTHRRRRDGKPAMVTSTVGKASGNCVNNPTTVLQDIINNLEANNGALQELVSHLEASKENDESGLKSKVNMHRTQISTQINRLKILKENLTTNIQSTAPEDQPKPDKLERPQAFDLFSPIPVEEKQSKVTDGARPPRVLSVDSGNFSVVSRQTSAGVDAADTVATVSVGDISHWYNEHESLASRQTNDTNPPPITNRTQRSSNQSQPTVNQSLPIVNQSLHPIDQSLCPGNQSISATERKYAADIRSVASGNDKVRELNADLDAALDRLQQILTNNFAMDDSCFDNSQLRETATEMEGLLGTLIRGVEQRATLNATKGLV